MGRYSNLEQKELSLHIEFDTNIILRDYIKV